MGKEWIFFCGGGAGEGEKGGMCKYACERVMLCLFIPLFWYSLDFVVTFGFHCFAQSATESIFLGLGTALTCAYILAIT